MMLNWTLHYSNTFLVSLESLISYFSLTELTNVFISLQLMSELVSNGVHIYQFPTDDETVSDTNAAMNVSLAVI